jgi:hypothetical protein
VTDDQIIDLVRQKHGVVLSPDDPVLAAGTIARAVAGDVATKAGGEIARSLDRAAYRLAQTHERRTMLLAAATLFGVAVIAGGGGYWGGYRAATAAHVLETCQGGEVHVSQQNGRRFCTMSVWLDPATPAKP